MQWGSNIGAIALACQVPPFLLGALFTFAPGHPVTEALFRPLLVASGPLLPLSVVLALMALGTPDRKRAALALALVFPAISCIMAGASRAHSDAERPRPAASVSPH